MRPSRYSFCQFISAGTKSSEAPLNVQDDRSGHAMPPAPTPMLPQTTELGLIAITTLIRRSMVDASRAASAQQLIW